MADDLAELAEEFRRLGEWISSPLYRVFGLAVADEPELLAMVARRRPGQVPVTALFAPVHFVLLGGAQHELREYYATLVGAAARPPHDAGPVLVDFCRRHREELAELVATRLVQKHVVKRSAMLRLGAWAVGREVSEPLHLVEIGASAGVHLRFDRHRYRIGGVEFGDPDSPVLIEPQWRGPVPDLDAIPRLASVTGIDLNPIDATDPEQRRWLQALVWPEEEQEAAQLGAALAQVAADPPRIIRGDAIDVCARLADELPAGAPRLVFHAAVRIHVPAGRQARFDAAVRTLGRTGPLYVLSLESNYPGLMLRRPGAEPELLARADGYGNWLEPC